jgi:hypothetical protein
MSIKATKLEAINLAPFIGAKNFSQSIAFYRALGWTIGNENDGVVEMSFGETVFYLQNAYQKDWCENTMMYLMVSDASAWYEKVQSVLSGSNYGLARVKEPVQEAHAKSVTYLWDPSGVLWHLAEVETR